VNDPSGARASIRAAFADGSAAEVAASARNARQGCTRQAWRVLANNPALNP
jgi:hypothetical protein